ncbi:ABC transporter substrate-binding protein [Candidatus Campbellbacteria bacterium CG10_big_fil_rev_8_21_14_0_10_35_52]|uniref:ABC transporter substrate-binding protein n=1 Tax=Candidatus Campbellbacteria bacterium CG10_big_fil_rev_8_21_14_0_10_35_52 TaxID=1974527 RepID=A0A2M6WVY6_9BACT|nr:MAG: ABC transporter substrate-binding protein [Candidatus Campbellbacteria bacterium CG10_big_fil_rev_8_21_14_0_10_35_52]
MKNIYIIIIIILLIVGGLFLLRQQPSKDTLNMLAWIGYEEPELIKPFEEQYKVKVNVKTYIGGDQMFTLLSQSKNQYDVVIVDPEFIEKLYGAGRLSELDTTDYNFNDYLEPFRKFPLAWINNKLYAVIVRFGSNGLAYNTKYLSQDDVSSYNVLWDQKVKGKVGIWDWYLPSMGVISKYLGFDEPYKLSEGEFQKLRSAVLSLKPQVAAVHPNPAEIKAALAVEQTWIVPAAGEWIVADLQADGYPIDWTVPKEGGIMWIEALVIPTDSQNIALAKKFIQYMQTPEAQSQLMWRKAYKSAAPNTKAISRLDETQQDTLHLHNAQEAIDLVNKLSVRMLPVNQSEAEWQKVWQEFKTR